MNKNMLIVIVLVVLVLLTAVQAVQLSSLKSQIKAGKISVGTSQGATSGSSASVPSNLNDLPSMVGGC